VKQIARGALITLAVLVVLVLVVPLLIPVAPLDTQPVTELSRGEYSRFIQLDFAGVRGLNVHYEEVGTGEPVFILLHGFASSTESWRRVMEPYSAYGRVIAVDWLPYGLTERPLPGSWEGMNPYSRAAQVEMVLAMMDALDVGPAILVGNSAGGALAVSLALDHPERVEAMILVSPAVFVPDSAEEESRRSGSHFGLLSSPVVRAVANTPQMNRLGPLLVRSIQRWGIDFGEASWHNPDLISEAWWQANLLPLQADNWDVGLWEMLKASGEGGPDPAVRLDELAMPVLVVTGDDDRIVPTANSLRLAPRIPSAELVVVEACGHIAHEECPEVFLTETTAWLDHILEQ
jgi:pimeloyl-ACP methyl ester carboxylesterase